MPIRWATACVAVAAGILLASRPTLAALPAVAAQASPEQISSSEEWTESLASFRQSVWLSYAPTAALGPDARGRTLAQDLAEWVLPLEVRRRLRTVGEHDRSFLEERARRLKLVQMYWIQQVSLRRQRALWSFWLQRVPAETARSSQIQISSLESRLQQDFLPSMTMDSLKRELNDLQRGYDQERSRLAELVGEGQPPAVGRMREMPCLGPVDSSSISASTPTHAVQIVRSPAPDDFYPHAARVDGMTGRVILQVTVDATGCAQNAAIVRSSGVPALDDAAINLSEYVRFAPAQRDGRPIVTNVGMPIVFKLEQTDAGGTRPPSPDPGARAHVRHGNDLLEKWDYDGAIAEFDQAIALDRNNATAYADRGLAHLWKAEQARAKDDFDSADRLDPGNAIASRGRGVLAFKSGDCDGAVVSLSRSLVRDSRSAFALLWRAQAYSCLKQDDDALADLLAAEQILPTTTASYSQRALVLRSLHRNEEALAEATGVLAANGDSAEAYRTAGAIYAAAGRPAESQTSLDMAVMLSPTARSFLDRAMYRPPADLGARRGDLEEALRLDPQSEAAIVGLIRLHAELGDDGAELDAANHALAYHPDNAFLLLRRGIAYWKHNDRSHALEDLRAAQRRATTVQLNNLCYTLGTVNVALDVALEACNTVLAQVPHDPACLDSRAFVLLRLDRLEESLADYEAALKMRPHAAVTHYGRGLALRRLGRASEGDAEASQALALDATVADLFRSYGLEWLHLEGERYEQR